MCSRYQSPAMAPCYDGEELPVDEAPTLEPEAVEPETPEPVVELITPEQLAAKLAERDLEWQNKLSEAQTELNAIRGKRDADLVERSLASAAVQGNAFNAEQILPLLKGHTSIINGQPVVQVEGFVMSPSEAISWMRSQPERFGNLFKSNVVAGFGLHNAPDGMRSSHPRNTH